MRNDAIETLTGEYNGHKVLIKYFVESDECMTFEDLTGGKIKWDDDLYAEATNHDNARDNGVLDDMRAALTAVRGLASVTSFTFDTDTEIDTETGFADGEYGGFTVDQEYGIPVNVGYDRGVADGCSMEDPHTVQRIASGDLYPEVVTIRVYVDGVAVACDSIGGILGLGEGGYGYREAAREHGLDSVDVGSYVSDAPADPAAGHVVVWALDVVGGES